MNKKDLPLLALLLVVILLLPLIDRKYVAPLFTRPTPPSAPAAAEPSSPRAPPSDAPAVPPPDFAPAEEEPAIPETLLTLSNNVLVLTFSSHGAGLVEAVLPSYPMSQRPGSGSVRLDFRAVPALVYEGARGLGDGRPFAPSDAEASSSARLTLERRTAAGLRLRRTFELEPGSYVVRIRDEFANEGAGDAHLTSLWVRLGEMRYLPDESRTGGFEYLGIDSLSPGERVTYWGRNLPKLFAASTDEPPPDRVAAPLLAENRPAEWFAVKNKYFVQILKPMEERFERLQARLRRVTGSGEGRRPRIRLEAVAAAAMCAPRTLGPGERWTLSYELYLGPKKHDILRRLDAKRSDVLEFGWAGGIGKLLLGAMNSMYAVMPNYGVAILLLTILIRALFWPLTHKSTESMKRMQALAPQIKELQARYKNNPQRLNKETLELYRRHKVNPLSGCLPLLVQLPVLFALFVVLRSAIELRFAPFLWIRDLSEPENLLKGWLPFGLALNPLPLVMTALQVWQSKLTPTAGDPAQQKMMVYMPVLMLFFFYGFPSGLVLYWTMNQALMIGQLLRQRRAARTSGGSPP